MNCDIQNTNLFTFSFKKIVYEQFTQKNNRDIWKDSEWEHIANLGNDDVGNVGENTIQEWCQSAGVKSNINGRKNKKKGGGNGDGTIRDKSVEIKTSRLNSSGDSFQHELGETPWLADYMIFLDIAPHVIYLTIFPNFTEEYYKLSGTNSTVKCAPVFPTRSICWRKQKGAFKLDTSVRINEGNINKNYTFKFTLNKNYNDFYEFLNRIIPSEIET
jgi:hypothetical protein